MRLLPAFFLVLAFVAALYAQNEQAPILEKDIAYKDWKLKDIRNGREIDLREFIKGKKLVAVVYFAPWCPNWRHDAPMLQRLYDKYKDKGFEIVAVGEYDPVDSMKKNLDDLKITFPAVYESESRDSKQKTTHYDYRRSTGDNRNWGSPYYVFIDPARVEKKGDLLLARTYVIDGEMIETEGETFIRQKLGLAPLDTKLTSANQKDSEVCEPAKPVEFKKP